MNPLRIIRTWFSDPDYIDTVAYTTLTAVLAGTLVLVLQAL